jgi:hypothetical protein
MSVLNQLPDSTLSLQGNGFSPSPTQADWGYPTVTPYAPADLIPESSKLHSEYSVNGNPRVYVADYNRLALGGATTVKTPSTLDELDPIAPRNLQAGLGGVVSQIYKSPSGQRYRDLGPQPGRY